MDQSSLIREALRQKNALRGQMSLPPVSARGTYLAPRKNAGIISKTKREKLFKRDKFICQICGRRFPERNLVPNHKDHDRTHNAMSNLEAACLACNLNEGMIYARLLREAGPRSEVTEVKRMQIVDRTRRLARMQPKGK